ncbi:uncharacterized protein BX664DRAFT_354746, partial [Halteromyces radiatus]|uniref:uncharacterized protein n=1 Tax=Halteromyces radiatus TaxID=101107 RepID=UPI002220E92D
MVFRHAFDFRKLRGIRRHPLSITHYFYFAKLLVDKNSIDSLSGTTLPSSLKSTATQALSTNLDNIWNGRIFERLFGYVLRILLHLHLAHHPSSIVHHSSFHHKSLFRKSSVLYYVNKMFHLLYDSSIIHIP